MELENETSHPQARTREAFRGYLTEIINYPERRLEIVDAIESVFGESKAILVLDMSGFSRTTQQHGILSFLLMIHQMQLISRPAIEQAGGKVIKGEADNLFCLFDQVAEAVAAAKEIINRLTTVNMILPVERRLYVAFGVGYGKILNIADEDLFGDEVNLACKLGEDIAGKGEILLTAAAKVELGTSPTATREEVISISGISLAYHVVE